MEDADVKYLWVKQSLLYEPKCSALVFGFGKSMYGDGKTIVYMYFLFLIVLDTMYLDTNICCYI